MVGANHIFNRIISALAVLVFGVILGLGAYLYAGNIPTIDGIDFNALKRQNPDVVAWIRIEGTNVDYPVLRSGDDKDEDYYLDHDFKGNEGYPGSIYIQKANAEDFSDVVTVLYGHNMDDWSMFASLHGYEGGGIIGTSPDITLYTPDGKHIYKIFAVKIYDDRLLLDEYDYFTKDKDVVRFISDITSVSDVRDFSDAAIDSDMGNVHYIVLSTCTAESTERLLVVGKET